MSKYLGIEISKEIPSYIDQFSETLLKDFYLKDNESIQQRFATPATAFCYGDYDFAQRIYNYVDKGWLVYSSPVNSNAPVLNWDTKYKTGSEEGANFVQNSIGSKHKGQPISCFLSFVADTIDGQIKSDAELANMSIIGGGVGKHLQMRGITSKSPGAIPYVVKDNGAITYYKQGETRKGSVAHYLDVSHPDIVEFINIRVPTGGDINRKAFNIHNAVNLSDEFLEAVRTGSEWNLVNPHNDEITETLKARDLWQSMLESRFRTGEPYLNNIDQANRHLPKSQQDIGLKIHGSNLCNEIHLPTDDNRSAVCCLSSVNVALFDEWKGDELFISDCVRFLDNVLQFFIDCNPKGLHKAVYSAKSERAIGLGQLGWHTYLQRNNIAWESEEASSLSSAISNHIQGKAKIATKKLAKELGEPSDLIGTGNRNSHLIAIAPNANSGIIAGVSASIEPIRANCYTHRTRAGAFLVKNKELKVLLDSYAPSDDPFWIHDQWKSISDNHGSVQHLDYLAADEKDTFKTAMEIPPISVVNHARIRQPHVCQGQSVNLFFPAGTTKADFNKAHLAAFDSRGVGAPLKGLYYCRTEAKQKADQVSIKVERNALSDYETQAAKDGETEADCLSCQG